MPDPGPSLVWDEPSLALLDLLIPGGHPSRMKAHPGGSRPVRSASQPILLMLALVCLLTFAARATDLSLRSPGGRIHVTVSLDDSTAAYAVQSDDETILAPSRLGLDFTAGGPIRHLRLVSQSRAEADETWRPVWGIASEARDRHNELRLELQEAGPSARRASIVFRAFDDGVAFRYEIPEQPGLDAFAIDAEETEFRFADDPRAWWIPAEEFAYESLHRETPVSDIRHANTPLTMRTSRGTWITIHEAALVDYSEMSLERTDGRCLRAHLWPWPDGPAVRAATPFKTPWRTIQIASHLGALAESHLIQNLNEPCAIADPSWIRPMKFVGIWWGMHTGDWTWSPGPRHGATTERAKETIDFASRHGIDAVLAEGWNLGWETWGAGEPIQDFTTPYPDFDLAEVARYAGVHGVALIGHHETGGNIPVYERQMEGAFALCERLGIRVVKTGYAGPILPSGLHHHGQWMVNHFRRVVETAARHRVSLAVHEGIKPTGLERTWPNLMTTEAVRGMEWNATLNTIPARHSTILPFTRFLAGPADATPGIFRLDFGADRGLRVHATRANQLALYVVFWSPLMMLADRIENYEGEPAFAFLEQVPCTWDETRALDARMGDYAAFARRKGDAWFVGCVADEQAREIAIPLSFLDATFRYRAEVYADAFDTDWQSNPASVEMGTYAATAADTLRAALSKAGGIAVRLIPDPSPALPSLARFNASVPERMRRFAILPEPGNRSVTHQATGAACSLDRPPSPKYALGSLTDGRIASSGFQDDAWLGFEGDDLVAMIALDESREVYEITFRSLHDIANWIQLPLRVLVETSIDGRTFHRVGVIEPEPGARAEIRSLRASFAPRQARYLRVTAAQRPLPDGHPGHGRPGWIFCDEIEVR